MNRIVLVAAAAFASVALAQAPKDGGSPDNSFLGLVKSGDRFRLETRGGESMMYSLDLLTDAEAARRESEREEHRKRAAELLKQHEWLDDDRPADTPEITRAWQERINTAEGRKIWQEYRALRLADRDQTFEVKRVGGDCVAYQSGEHVIYLPVSRIFSIKESIERFRARGGDRQE